MRKKIFLRHEKEFIALSGEGRPGRTVGEETQDLFRQADRELKELSLSLENTVRIRIWGKDGEARNQATAERSRILTERTKASSSSYICPGHFESRANVALDVIAMRPANPNLDRRPVDFDPARNYLRYLIYDSFLFLSGCTSAGSNLDNQLAQILSEIEVSLADGGTSWDNVSKPEGGGAQRPSSEEKESSARPNGTLLCGWLCLGGKIARSGSHR
jgi:enamine deaminase RidA (YjgF/YER057c/UK114 family)